MAQRKKNRAAKSVVKVPLVMQLESLECGAASLAMVLAYYDKWIPLEQIRADCGVSRDGSNALSIVKAARHYGLDAKGYRFEPKALRESGAFPCIIHWNFNHFLVLDGFRGNKAYLNDPANGIYCVSMEEFDKSFTGVCIILKPGESFVPSGKQKSIAEFARRRLKGSGAAIAFAAFSGIIASLMGIINPAFSRVFLDRLLTRQNADWTSAFLILLGVFNLIQIIVSAIHSAYSLRINGKMAAVGNAVYMWKVLRMPIAFFSQRMAGDIQERQSSNAQIANTLIGTFAPLILNSLMMLFYFAVMLRYSPLLTAVGLISLTLNAFISNFISKKLVNITRVSMRDGAKLASVTAAGIEMIETIKANGAENGFFAKWAGYQANVNAQQIKYQKLNHYFGMIPQFISSLADNAVLIIGVMLTMDGQFTVGMIMAFQGFLSSFMAPAVEFISVGRTLQEMRTQMERVDDVMEYPEDDIFADEGRAVEGSGKLPGNIELKNLSFGYSRLSEPVLKNFSLSVSQGKSVAVIGATGCGKSTVSKLMSGLYKPWSGEILYDGKPLSEIDKNTFTSSVAVVNQEITIYEGSIEDNIKMWDRSIENFEMILAARDAQIHDDIMSRADGYKSLLSDGGRELSGGQKQRIEIARVLAQDPTVIILDEATSALDAKTEYELVKAIRNRGITCVVIAHRLSTIRSCDEIILMDKGEIAARGTHAELMANSPLYNELIISE